MISQVKKIVKLYKEYSSEDNILIYQMGKVGSTSLEKSIPNSIHVHTLYSNWFLPNTISLDSYLRNKEKQLGNLIKRLALKCRKNVKIITIIRDPFDRDISMFFQDLPQWISGYNYLENYDTRNEKLNLLQCIFNDFYDYTYALTWFDKELKKLTDIDIYDYPYDPDKGYIKIRKGRYEVLVLECSKLTECKLHIDNFTGTSITAVNTNKSIAKWYAPLYIDFKEKYRPNEKYISSVKESKFYIHFFKK